MSAPEALAVLITLCLAAGAYDAWRDEWSP